MPIARRVVQFLVLCQVAAAQVPQAAAVRRAEEIGKLSQQLRWRDEVTREKYEDTKRAVTQSLLTEVDGFVQESFRPSTVSADLVTAGVDALMGYRRGDLTRNVAFLVDLASDHYLVLGVDVRRGGPAISEDAICFRAYKATGDAFGFVAESGIWDDVIDLHAQALPSPPVPGEFWLLGSAVVPPKAPPMVSVRLYAFDGSAFRTVWAPPAFTAEGAAGAIQLAAGGFVLNKLFDPTGHAAMSPTVVVHDQYVLTPEGPSLSGEWQTERQ